MLILPAFVSPRHILFAFLLFPYSKCFFFEVPSLAIVIVLTDFNALLMQAIPEKHVFSGFIVATFGFSCRFFLVQTHV